MKLVFSLAAGAFGAAAFCVGTHDIQRRRPRLHPCVFFAVLFNSERSSLLSRLSFLFFRHVTSPTTAADGRTMGLAAVTPEAETTEVETWLRNDKARRFSKKDGFISAVVGLADDLVGLKTFSDESLRSRLVVEPKEKQKEGTLICWSKR